MRDGERARGGGGGDKWGGKTTRQEGQPGRNLRTLEMDDVISWKKDFSPSSGASKTFAWRSQSALHRISPKRTQPRLLLYRKFWQCDGWKSAEVMTSESVSMLDGLASTRLKQQLVLRKFHKFTLRSSQEINDSPSEFSASELM